MAITVKWKNLALTPKLKTLELPDHAYDIHLECGGWYTSENIYLWWKEYGNDKCKKLITTKWPNTNIKRVRQSLDVIPSSVGGNTP